MDQSVPGFKEVHLVPGTHGTGVPGLENDGQAGAARAASQGLGSHCPCHEDHLCQEVTLGELSLKDLVLSVVWVFCFVL